MLRCDVLKLQTGVTESVASKAQTLAFSAPFNAVSNVTPFQQALTNTSISPYANLTKSVQSSGHFFVSLSLVSLSHHTAFPQHAQIVKQMSARQSGNIFLHYETILSTGKAVMKSG